MPHREKIENKAGNHLWSIEIYEPGFFENYNPHTKFQKWAAVEVEDFGHLPDGFETLSVAEGLYAVFIHKGPASEASKTYQYIFGKWLPKSDYELDDRPHFAVMGEKYKNEHPDSEEELWIPVKSGKE